MVAGLVRLEHLEVIAYTYKMVYDMGVQDVRLRALYSDEGDSGLALDHWGPCWGFCCWGCGPCCICSGGRQRNRDNHRKCGGPSATCFCPSGIWTSCGGSYGKNCRLAAEWNGMGHRVGSKLCPLCHTLEDHEHVLRHC